MAKLDAGQQAYRDSLKALVADDPAALEALDAMFQAQFGESDPHDPARSPAIASASSRRPHFRRPRR
jgi:hypothetical protein